MKFRFLEYFKFVILNYETFFRHIFVRGMIISLVAAISTLVQNSKKSYETLSPPLITKPSFYYSYFR